VLTVGSPVESTKKCYLCGTEHLCPDCAETHCEDVNFLSEFTTLSIENQEPGNEITIDSTIDIDQTINIGEPTNE
jgi:hypothetical protein